MKLKSLWRIMSLTWSSLVVKLHFWYNMNRLKPSCWGELPLILDAKDNFELWRRLNFPSPVFQTVSGRQKYVAADLGKKEKFCAEKECLGKKRLFDEPWLQSICYSLLSSPLLWAKVPTMGDFGPDKRLWFVNCTNSSFCICICICIYVAANLENQLV